MSDPVATLHMSQDGLLYCRLPNGKLMYCVLTESPLPVPVAPMIAGGSYGSAITHYQLVPTRR